MREVIEELVERARREFDDAALYGITDTELADVLGVEARRATAARRILRAEGSVVPYWGPGSDRVPEWPRPQATVWISCI